MLQMTSERLTYIYIAPSALMVNMLILHSDGTKRFYYELSNFKVEL